MNTGIQPRENDWSPEEALFFKSIVNNKTLRVGENITDLVIHKNQQQQPLQIELFFGDDDSVEEEHRNKSIADILISKNIAFVKQ